ncbi:MAG TPA: TIGR00730 family Rossman fold protein [Pirellulales bacterium]|nr:TIGR00730 family Rossman fold protein [Pirellulales bacterium]
MRRLCVFCGSASGSQSVYAEAAQQFGRLLVAEGWELVYGAGHVGLMGVIADAVLQAGGVAIGVIPRSLVERELAHDGLSELHVVETMHERKALMADLSDAFVALPGGHGTCDELFEILTWAQLRLHAKPIGMLNVANYFDPLLAWLDQTVSLGFVRPQDRGLLLSSADPTHLLRLLETHRGSAEEPGPLESDER